MIENYIDAGGALAARAPRGGLPAEVWALGWHRVHAAHWHLQLAALGVNGPETDAANEAIIRRQLTAAASLLT